MRILVTGGSGLLAEHLVPLLKLEDGDGTMFPRVEIDIPTHRKLDITQHIIPQDYDLIIHAAAFTDVVRAQTERDACFNVNVEGTINLAKAYKNIPFVYISSEYAHNPVNYYSLTKWLGELVVNEICEKALIIRTLFKPVPFPYPKAFMDQYTNGDEVTVIAPLICNAIFSWLGSKSELIYIGTGKKTIYDIAVKSRPDVMACSIDDIKAVRLPFTYE